MFNFKLLGDRLEWAKAYREQRTGLKCSWADMARICKATPAAVSRWKNNLNGIDGEYARPLASWLGVDAVWLESGEGDPTSNYNETQVGSIKNQAPNYFAYRAHMGGQHGDPDLYAQLGELMLLYVSADMEGREAILDSARNANHDSMVYLGHAAANES